MKVLIIHYKFGYGGGPERYLHNITDLLKSKGHEVIHFAPKWNDNLSNVSDKYWPEIPGSGGYFNYNENKNLSLKGKLRLLKEVIYSKTVFRSLNVFISREKPDVALLLLYLGKLTPAVIKACNKNNLPVVSRISDFSHLCLNSILHDGNSICLDCVNGAFWSGVKKNCFRSKTNSFIQYLIRRFYYNSRYQYRINAFLIPSRNSLSVYSKSKLFEERPLFYLPSFVQKNLAGLDSEKIELRHKKRRFIYSGRISPEKDIEGMISAFHNLNKDVPDSELVILGFKEDQYSISVMELLKELDMGDRIVCKSFLPKEELIQMLEESSYMVFPSKIYDNLPQAVLEAQSIGLPVIAPKIGSLAEIVEDKKNGFTYELSDEQGLYSAMAKSDVSFETYFELSKASWELINNEYNSELHYSKLIDVFHKVLTANEKEVN